MAAIPLMLGLSPDGVAALVVKVLAVGGAFLAGFLLVGILVFLLDHWLTRGKSNRSVKRVCRLSGGVAAAVFAAMVLFGSGGDGFLGGTGTAGTGTPDGAATTEVKTSTTVPTPAPQALVATPAPTDTVVRITVLGGTDVKEGRFYLVDSDTTPLDLEDVKKAILARKPMDATKATVVIQLPEKNAPANDHPAVIVLARWAKEKAGLGVYQPPTPK